jgi:hypothetical protein
LRVNSIKKWQENIEHIKAQKMANRRMDLRYKTGIAKVEKDCNSLK